MKSVNLSFKRNEVRYMITKTEIKKQNSSTADLIERVTFLFRHKLEDIKSGVSIVVNERIIYMNRRSREIFGVNDLEERSYSIYDFVDSGDVNRIHKIRQRAMKEKKLPESISFWIIGQDGRMRYITNRYILLKTNSGNPIDRIVITAENKEIRPLSQNLHELELKCKTVLEKFGTKGSMKGKETKSQLLNILRDLDE